MSEPETTNDELEAQNGELLPDREAMSVITPLGEDLTVADPKFGGEPGLPPPRD